MARRHRDQRRGFLRSRRHLATGADPPQWDEPVYSLKVASLPKPRNKPNSSARVRYAQLIGDVAPRMTMTPAGDSPQNTRRAPTPTGPLSLLLMVAGVSSRNSESVRNRRRDHLACPGRGLLGLEHDHRQPMLSSLVVQYPATKPGACETCGMTLPRSSASAGSRSWMVTATITACMYIPSLV